MYYTYILKSKISSKYYIGYSNNPKQRLFLHNSGKITATKNRGPWDIIFTEIFETEKQAIQRERQIKSWKSRNAIERLLFSNINRGSSILQPTPGVGQNREKASL